MDLAWLKSAVVALILKYIVKDAKWHCCKKACILKNAQWQLFQCANLLVGMQEDGLASEVHFQWGIEMGDHIQWYRFFCLLYFLGECPDGWLNAGELGGCYLFALNGPGLNWQQSVDYCASIGGFLTDILNQETETFLLSSGFGLGGQSNPNVVWWIGGNDIAQVSKYCKGLNNNTCH